MGTNAAIRFAGGTAGGYIFKDPVSKGLFVRSEGSATAGGAIDMFDSGAPGNDGAFTYANTVRIWSGGQVAARFLNNQDVRFSAGLSAPMMKMWSDAGGTTTTRFTEDFALVENGPAITFTAPPSGVVRIDLNISLGGNNVDSTAIADVRVVRQSNGVNEYDLNGIIIAAGNRTQRLSGFRIVGGLIPGVLYTSRPLFASSQNSGTVSVTAGYSTIVVTPSL